MLAALWAFGGSAANDNDRNNEHLTMTAFERLGPMLTIQPGGVRADFFAEGVTGMAAWLEESHKQPQVSGFVLCPTKGCGGWMRSDGSPTHMYCVCGVYLDDYPGIWQAGLPNIVTWEANISQQPTTTDIFTIRPSRYCSCDHCVRCFLQKVWLAWYYLTPPPAKQLPWNIPGPPGSVTSLVLPATAQVAHRSGEHLCKQRKCTRLILH